MRHSSPIKSPRSASAGPGTEVRPPSENKTPWILQWLSMSVLCGTCHVHHEVYDEIGRACRLEPTGGFRGHRSHSSKTIT